MGTTNRPVEGTPTPARARASPARRKLSFPATLSVDSAVIPSSVTSTTKRRLSNVGDAVTRKLSTTIGWRRPPEEVIAVGKALCALYIRLKLKRTGLLSRKLGLSRVSSTIGTVPGAGSVTVRDVFPGLACACCELERTNPRLYLNIARQTGVPSDTGPGGLLAAIGHQMFRSEPSWGKVVAVFSIAGGLSVDCVRQGRPENIHDIFDGMGELLEDRLALWVASNGGWAGLNAHCRQEDQDISFVEYLGIVSLVLAILLAAYVVVRFIVKISNL